VLTSSNHCGIIAKHSREKQQNKASQTNA